MNWIFMKKLTIQQLYNYVLLVANSDPSSLLTKIQSFN